MMQLTHGELFAGIGGFGLGFDNAGMKTIWHVEIDQNCQNVLRRHNPDNLILGDVCQVGKHNLPYVDVISFGSPCQDLSIAGKRKGLIDGERSNLFFEAIRIVSELKPVIAVWENVPGAFSSNHGRDFAAVLGAFRDCGARDIAWRILDAQYFGVPQRRRRVFVVASFADGRRSLGKEDVQDDEGLSTLASEILFESEGLRRNTEKSKGTGQEIARTFTIRAGGGKGGKGYLGQEDRTLAISGQRQFVEPIVFQQNTRDEVRLMGGKGQYAGALSAQPGMKQQNYIAWQNHQQSGEIRIQKDNVPTLGRNIGTGGNNVPMIGVRRLTPIECERLQGFPDDWTSDQSDSVRYRQLGNAVAVPVVQWIGKRIVVAFS